MRSKIIIVLLAFGLLCNLARAQKAGSYKADLGVKKTPWGELHSFDRMQAKRTVPPSYPSSARRGGVTGEVGLAALIGEDGAVQEVKVLKSSGNEDLDHAALDALKGWKYLPLSPRERFVTIQPIIFDLQ